jgi:hypothetical protein
MNECDVGDGDAGESAVVKWDEDSGDLHCWQNRSLWQFALALRRMLDSCTA